MEKCREFVIKYKYLHSALANAKLKAATPTHTASR
jgi:hypothetical protein